MESARALSQFSASTSAALRPSVVSTRLVVRPPAPRRAHTRALRTNISVKAVAAAPMGQTSAASPAQASPLIDISSGEAFADLLEANKSKLVVLMCKATGCRPCKAFRVKYGKLALHYSDAVFCEILGDRNESTRNLMRSSGVKATPTFIFYRGGEVTHMHSGISSEKMVDALKAAVQTGEEGYCEEVRYAQGVLSSEEASQH